MIPQYANAVFILLLLFSCGWGALQLDLFHQYLAPEEKNKKTSPNPHKAHEAALLYEGVQNAIPHGTSC